uniref:Uncharacterized protein n=1 Tax=Chlorobium chlorochromatii (strain CaD3) TaxID=340177 RepID=Q3ATM6_CHLCH
MPLNLLKKYPELLEIAHMSEADRNSSLYAIFNRDFVQNDNLYFQGKKVRPIKGEDGAIAMDVLFQHLTTSSDKEKSSLNRNARTFEMARSCRLHWIRYHIDKSAGKGVKIFSCEERDQKRRKDVIRTYIFDVDQKYVIILEPQRSGNDYYLLTAYYLDRDDGKKQIEKKFKQRMKEVL